MNKIELLAPAGSFEALAAAVESGADAVYLGGSKFNARAYADNFDDDELIKAVDYAHLRGVKVYITVNILLFDRELEEVLDYIRFLYHIGVDAVIVQDFALIKLVKKLFPGMEVHCSTQMTVHNTGGAEFYRKLGADRVVLAREIPIWEVSSLIEKVGMDVEVFVHGALCISYSGQCLMSSMIGGRSGNRGRCAQPCRKKYSFFDFERKEVLADKKGKHLLSTRDLNTYHRLEEILKSGVKSLKIEGRMKKPEYVAIVVKNYRDAIDSITEGRGQYPSRSAPHELLSAFNREFTEGYLFNNRNRAVVSIDRPDNRGVYLGKIVGQQQNIASILIENGSLNDGDGIEISGIRGVSKGSLISGIRVKGKRVKTAEKGDIAEVFVRKKHETGAKVNKTYDSLLHKKAREEYSPENKRKICLELKLYAKVGECPVLEIRDNDGNFISCSADEKVERAEKEGAKPEKVSEQLGKTGDTPYAADLIEIKMEDNCYLPARLLNLMRREGLSLFSQERTRKYKREMPEFNSKAEIKSAAGCAGYSGGKTTELIAGVRDLESAESAVKAGADTIYIISDAYRGDMEKDSTVLKELCGTSNTGIYYLMPSITRDSELKRIERRLINMKEMMSPLDLGIVISNAGQFKTAAELELSKLRINYSMNVFNSVTAGHFIGMGAESVCVSPELNLKAIGDIYERCKIPLEALVYGYLPVMTTEYCPLSLLEEDCKYSDRCMNSNYGIIDEKGKKFRLVKLNSCRTQILNSDVLFVPEELAKIADGGITKFRADFYAEKPEEIFEIVKLYKNYNSIGEKQKQLMHRVKDAGFTKGHFFRGVD